MRLGYAIVFVRDMKRSVAFYKEVMGLPLRFESPGRTEFSTQGATLALHASDRATRQTMIRITCPPAGAGPDCVCPISKSSNNG